MEVSSPAKRRSWFVHQVHVGDNLFWRCVLIGPGRPIGLGMEGKFQPVRIVAPFTFIAIGELGQFEIVGAGRFSPSAAT